MVEQVYDIAVIGGGINGAGIARDAAGRGLRVLLLEKGDLAQGTSSASSKLIHGGLRYLEQYEFRLVRESLQEREVLLGIAPHLIRPMEFVLPHSKALRPAWMLRAGLFLYDNLAKRAQVGGSRPLMLGNADVYGAPLQTRYSKGFCYNDCWVDDARLVVLNALDAAEHGADIRTRTACTGAMRENGQWSLALSDGRTEKARILINAAGPWVAEVLGQTGSAGRGLVKLVKGSHIVVPRIHEGEHAYILQMDDKRIVFVLPFEEKFSLIGTTDMGFDGDPVEVGISQEEIDYLLAGVNTYLAKPLSREDIVWTYSGVRSLYDDASENLSAMTRDYVLAMDEEGAPLLSVFGGKITTYRRLAEHALEKLARHLPKGSGGKWTGKHPLPGAEEAYAVPDWVDAALAARWKRQYGSRAAAIIGEATDMNGLDKAVAPQVFEAELRYAREHEWAKSGDDFLWRRTKLGLHLNTAERDAVKAWFG